MTKKTDQKNTKDDDKDLENEEAENESEEDEDEEDEETSDEEEDEEEDEDEDEDEEEEDEEAAPAKPSAGKAAENRRPRHEEYLAGDDTSGGQAEDPTWWAPHAVLGVLVLLGVLGFLGVFNKALGFLAPKPSGAETSAEQKTTTARPGSPGQPPTTQQPQAPREMFGAKHLLVMYKGSKRAPATIERTKEEAKARATEAAKKAKADPGKFADLVKEYSDEPGAGDRGGDLGKFPKGAMVPEFQAGLEKIKVGEISDVVESAFGFHVILRTQ